MSETGCGKERLSVFAHGVFFFTISKSINANRSVSFVEYLCSFSSLEVEL